MRRVSLARGGVRNPELRRVLSQGLSQVSLQVRPPSLLPHSPRRWVPQLSPGTVLSPARRSSYVPQGSRLRSL